MKGERPIDGESSHLNNVVQRRQIGVGDDAARGDIGGGVQIVAVPSFTHSLMVAVAPVRLASRTMVLRAKREPSVVPFLHRMMRSDSGMAVLSESLAATTRSSVFQFLNWGMASSGVLERPRGRDDCDMR